MDARKLARGLGAGALIAASLAGYALAAGQHMPYAAAAVRVGEPHRIVLVRSETGLALDHLRWKSARRASGELDLTGEGAGQVGSVRVTVRRDGAGRIGSLRLAGSTSGIAKSRTFSHGHWSAS